MTDKSWDIPIEELNWRVMHTNREKTKAQYLAYPDARQVAEKMDEVFGWDNWQDSYEVVSNPSGSEPLYAICVLKVWSDSRGEWIIKQGLGTSAAAEPWKSAESDAFKRAAAKLGIGRNVYSFPPIWAEVSVNDKGYTYAPKGIEKKLLAEARKILDAGESLSITQSLDSQEQEKSEPVDKVSSSEWNTLVSKMKGLDQIGKKVLREKWDNVYSFAPELVNMTRESFKQLSEWTSDLLNEEDPTKLAVEGFNGTVVE